MIYDLIIIGAGPAGMAAALYAARQNLNSILVTKDIGGLANYVPELKTYLGYYYLTGYDLIEKFKEHLSHYNVNIKMDEVKKINKQRNFFEVKTKDNKYNAKTLIISAGRRFKKLDVPQEDKYLGKGLSLCTACDGPLFKDKVVAVVGGGRSGLFATLFLLKLAKKIYLIEKDRHLKTSGGLKHIADMLEKNKKVKIILNANVTGIKGNNFVNAIVFNKNKELEVEGVFVEVGYVPNTEFVKHLVKTNDRGEIIVDEEGRTSCKGIFAAGDITNIKEKQVMVSCGEGTKSLLSALTYLEENLENEG